MRTNAAGMTFRPWGRIDRVLPHFQGVAWSVIGCIGPEDRSIAVPLHLEQRGAIAALDLIEVVDPPSQYSAEAQASVHRRSIELSSAGINYTTINAPLLGAVDGIIQQVLASCGSGENVVLDITSLPKRFFFLLIKELRSRASCRNLIVSYTRPRAYPSDTEESPISQDCATHAALPGFGPMGGRLIRPSKLVVSVGHSILNLPGILQDQLSSKSSKVVLMFPFPPGPPSYQKNWDFVENIYNIHQEDKIDVRRLDGFDVSASFDFLMEVSNYGEDCIWLLPYGPKPMSIAMALFASATEMPVYYTQPSRYRPDYSIGIGTETNKTGGEVPAIYMYPVRLNGQCIYTASAPLTAL